ncbi:hypothetical protein [Sorangium sp. So ce1389]|uniref:hypothetical protein n=1 Tax=Sorangium sp. So ce1389 TaxID=3133336 RepID=UPI003F641E1F
MGLGSLSVLGLAALTLLGCISGVRDGTEEDGAGGAPEAPSAGTGTTSAGTGTNLTTCDDLLTEEDCEAQASRDEGYMCAWKPVRVTADEASCDEISEEHRCLRLPPGGPGSCVASLECGRNDGQHLLYRRVGGTIELHRFDGVCGFIPTGWEYCDWDPDGNLVDGPASCACSCP